MGAECFLRGEELPSVAFSPGLGELAEQVVVVSAKDESISWLTKLDGVG